MYKALYRKYRPLIFDDVYDQDVIVKILRNSIINNSYSHAYMFFGPRGTGKTSISKIFARSLNCLNPQNGNSCGECKNCLKSYDKECIDIIEIDAASNNGVDEIRELRNKVALVPSDLKFKVYIIDEVHMLSIGAFNALLKTLEEPPAHVIFILATTDPQKVPETIISRCQCFAFKRISEDNIYKNLSSICKKENINVDDEVLHLIASSCDGGMRDALSSLDQLHSFCNDKITLNDYAEVNGTLTNKDLEKFYESIFTINYSQVLNEIKNYNESGKNIIAILENLMRIMRNDLVEYYLNSVAPKYNLNCIHKFVLLINQKMNEIKKSSNPVIYIEMLLLNFMNEISISNIEKKETIDDKDEKQFKIIKNVIVEQKTEHKEKMPVINDKNVNNEIKSKKNELIIQNIKDIMHVRVNNTLALANKKYLKDELTKLDLFNDYTFDQYEGYIACSILDSKIRVASEENLIISFEYDSSLQQALREIDKFTLFYNKVTNSNKKLAFISDSEWEIIKNNYIDKLKNNIKIEVMEEPKEVFIEVEKDGIISSSAIDLFGDIVEVK